MSKDAQFQFTGYILLAKKLTDGDGELLQPHTKARKHWLPWEESTTRDYFWDILRATGKENTTPKSLELSDIRVCLLMVGSCRSLCVEFVYSRCCRTHQKPFASNCCHLITLSL